MKVLKLIIQWLDQKKSSVEIFFSETVKGKIKQRVSERKFENTEIAIKRLEK
jgi:hypothetical protein